MIELLYKNLCRIVSAMINYPIKQGGPRSGMKLPETTRGFSVSEKGSFSVIAVLKKPKEKNCTGM